MKKYLKWIICFISLIIFMFLGVLVLTKNDIYLDYVVYNFISKYISNDLTFIVKNLTHLASAFIVILITLMVFVLHKNKKYGIFMAIDLILITIFQYALKLTFLRVRPVDINLIEETGYSFPSGHSLTAMAFYGFIIYLIRTSNLNRRSKNIYTILFSIIILVVGLSRVYLGVHFFTDVVGAFSFSLVFLIIYTYLIKGKVR
ncbi:MAG: phosphatase PAP2 family protein [Bacilli bacterium]|nr:phosphatase PAP2 family protein [Bacilli bacterium]